MITTEDRFRSRQFIEELTMRRYIVFIGLLCISLNKTNAQKEVRTNRVNQQERFDSSRFTLSHGAIVRGDSTKKSLALVFTADEFGEGLQYIEQTLRREKVKGSFFFTGRFYRNKEF